MATTKKTEKTEAAAERAYTYAVGKRKTAIARVRIYRDGASGQLTVNGRAAKEYFCVSQNYAAFHAPLGLLEIGNKELDVDVKVLGGGPTAQAEAARHGLARALEKENEARRKPLKQAGFLTRDSRVKERKKPGLKRARRSPQWAKR